MMKTRLRGRYVIGFDEQKGTHVIIDDGEVVYEDNRILFVGKHYPGQVDREVDATECIISPGLINGHALMDVSIYQYGFDRPQEKGYHRPRAWTEDPSETEIFTPREIQQGADLSFLNFARSGCTTVLGITSMVFKRWDDPEWEPEIYLQAAVKHGLRAYLSHHYRARAPYSGTDGRKEFLLDEDRGQRGLERCIAFIKKYDGAFGGRIGGTLFPYTLDQSTPELLKATAKAAEDLDVPIRMHTAQSRGEMEFLKAEYGKDPIEYLKSLDVLSPRWLLTHSLFVAGNHPGTSAADLEVMARHGVSVANCPWIYSFRGEYLNSLSRYQQAGVNMLVGTDTFPQDLFREMRWAAMMAKTAEGSPVAGQSREVFDAVTVNAARYLGRDDLGVLKPGAKADLVLIDTERFSMGPTEDPIRSLVYFATAADVKTVIVDGDVIVDDYESLRVDEARVVRESQGVSDKVRDTLAGWQDPQKPPREIYTPTYPRI